MKNEKLKFEVLEHKADLKIRAFGKTKEELFLNMLLGMAGALRAEVKNKKPEHKKKGFVLGRAHKYGLWSKIKKIKIKSLDLEALLVDFLSEALYLSQVNKEIYSDIKFKKFTDPSTGSGQAEIEGELIGQKVERFGEDIKAVTYHGLEICQRKDGTWEATVLFDI